MTLFTSFDGRISRRGFWLGFLGMAVAGIVIGLAVLAIFPTGVASRIAQLAAAAGFFYVWAAVVVKRLHDRDKPAIPYAAIFLAPALLNSVMKVFLVGYSAVDISGVEYSIPGTPALIVIYVALAVSIWMLVELGFFKGTPGENRYGPNPIGSVNA